MSESKCESEVSFRIGLVKAYRRGKVWYLCYHEDGQRRRPKIGPDRRLHGERPLKSKAISKS